MPGAAFVFVASPRPQADSSKHYGNNHRHGKNNRRTDTLANVNRIFHDFDSNVAPT